jgi:hypothetical protein
VPSRWKIGLWIAGGTILAIVGVVIVASVEISRSVHGWVEDSLSHEFKSKVELSSFRIAVQFPLVRHPDPGKNPSNRIALFASTNENGLAALAGPKSREATSPTKLTRRIP